jgi:hypothetical protein
MPYISQIIIIKDEQKFFNSTKVFNLNPNPMNQWKSNETNQATTKGSSLSQASNEN